MPAPLFALPEGPAVALGLPPRLESWNARDHRDQVALRAWVSHVRERVHGLGERLDGELAFRLDVRLPDNVDPLWQRDLDNYLYPIARELPERYVSIWATKGPGQVSYVRVESANRIAIQSSAWTSFEVPRTPRGDDAWKRGVASAVADGPELQAGPVALQIAFTVGDAAKWPQMWKPSIDGLEAVLGSSFAARAWNPQDGRIVRLGLHRGTSPELGRDAEATVWVRSAPLDWEENAWLRALSEEERTAFLQQHLARVARSQRLAFRAAGGDMARARQRRRSLTNEPGVVVFVDDDEAYASWLSATPSGYVLNALRTPSTSPVVLHRATCRTISGQPARGRTWTAGVYLKACSTDSPALAHWLEANGGRPARACGSCAP